VITGWSITWGDGPAQAITGNPTSATHTYADGLNSYTISATATDTAGTYPAGTVPVTVNNVAPTATFGNDGPVNEGIPATVSFKDVVDPGTADTFTYSFDWNNDETYEIAEQAAASAQHTWTANGVYTVKGKVKDKDGGFTEYTTTVTVNHVTPTLSISGASSVNEGTVYTLTLSSSSSAITGWSITWGNGPAQAITGNPTSVTHTYADGPNSYTISATATDTAGTYPAGTVPVTVNNVAPTATFNAPASVTKGSPIAVSLSSVTDPSGADIAAGFTFAFKTGSAPITSADTFSSTPTVSFPTTVAGSITVRGAVRDKNNDFTEYTQVVTVNMIPVPTSSLNRAVFRASNKSLNWFFDTNMDGKIEKQDRFGQLGDIPLVGDFNKDGITDRAIFRSLTSGNNWFFDYEMNGTIDKQDRFGQAGDIPVVGDFDKDGIMDRAVFRGVTRGNNWFFDTNMDGKIEKQDRFGQLGDIPVVGDFDKDGIMDRAVFRGVTRGNNWFFDYGMNTTIEKQDKFGQLGDIPLVGDFNKDGIMDRAVFRSLTSGDNWFFDYEINGTTDKQDKFGQLGDLPLIWNQ
jgi:hypothetical protein